MTGEQAERIIALLEEGLSELKALRRAIREHATVQVEL